MTVCLHEEVTWPVHTARMALRPATVGDLAATWQFRRLPAVSRWLTQGTRNIDGIPQPVPRDG